MSPLKLTTLVVIVGLQTHILQVKNTSHANELTSSLAVEKRKLSRAQERQKVLTRAAKKATDELGKLKRRSVSLAQSIQNQYRIANRLETSLISLRKKIQTKSKGFAKSKKQLAVSLVALQRIARIPKPALLVIPLAPHEISRTATLLQATVPKLKQDANSLATELRALSGLRRKIKSEKHHLSDTLGQMEIERQKLEVLTSKRLRLFRLIHKERNEITSRITRISTRALSLRELLKNLSETKNGLTSNDAILEPSQHIFFQGEGIASGSPRTYVRDFLPVPGRIVRSFGENLKNGTKSKGIFIATMPAAPVVAPEAGRVVFAGIFRSYGKIVILALPNRRHALISGMAEISATIGDEVLAGEPLGEMPSSTLTKPSLYFELRKSGRPINPMSIKLAPKLKAHG